MDSPQAQTSQPRELPPLPPGARPRPINGGFRSPAPPSSILTHRRPPSIHGRPPSPGSSSRRPPPRPVRQTSDIILPPWQPDSSVSDCPICHSGFTFFNRRHHCRKCGRVVCHSCSPHRITIPKAFVVQPPPSSSPCYTSSVPPANPSEGSSNITRSNNRASWGPEDGGILRRQSSSGDEDDGLQVRMCDECLGPHNRTQGGRSVPHPHHSNFPIPRNSYMNYNQPPPSHYNSLPSRRPPHNYYPVSNRRGELPHFQPPPQPRLKETDYCPICTLALPPIRQNGSEEDREAHIQNCIRQVEHSISPGPTSTIGSAPSRMGSAPGRSGEVMRARRYTGGGRMVVWKATEKDTWASVGDDEVTPSSTPVPVPAVTPVLKVSTSEDGEGREENAAGGEGGDVSGEERTGDVAGETTGAIAEGEGEEAKEESKEEVKEVKEGVKGLAGGSSGEMVKKQMNREKVECVICFEEFEVGDIIARLECLCRYHKKCIREWFDRKGNGECPVHAVHD